MVEEEKVGLVGRWRHVKVKTRVLAKKAATSRQYKKGKNFKRK